MENSKWCVALDLRRLDLNQKISLEKLINESDCVNSFPFLVRVTENSFTTISHLNHLDIEYKEVNLEDFINI